MCPVLRGSPAGVGIFNLRHRLSGSLLRTCRFARSPLLDEVSFVLALVYLRKRKKNSTSPPSALPHRQVLQVIGVAVCLPRSSHGRHRRHCTCQDCKHRGRYSGVLLSSAPLLGDSFSGSRLVVSLVVAVSPLLVSLALLLFVFHLRFHFPGITSGPLSCFTPQSYYLPAERQGHALRV